MYKKIKKLKCIEIKDEQSANKALKEHEKNCFYGILSWSVSSNDNKVFLFIEYLSLEEA